MRPRAGKVAFVYCEPLGPHEGMTSDGINYLNSFIEILPYLDDVFVHTSQMRSDMITYLGNRLAGRAVTPDAIPWMQITSFVHVLPAGLDPSVMVTPDWESPKDIDFLFYGSIAGKRQWSLPMLSEALAKHDHTLKIATNVYGKELGALLNRSKVSIYVAHSDVYSFSTWRAWQTSFTSAVMAIECLDGKRADAWPFEPHSQYVPLPMLKSDGSTTDEYVERLLGMLTPSVDRVAWQWARTAAHSNYLLATREFSAERCIEEYLTKAGEVIFKEMK